MSAVVGIYNLKGQPADESTLRAMCNSLAHRGPDGEGIWQTGSVGLGQRMLHVTPESLHDQQPRISTEGPFVLAADARIDNRDELIAALRLSDYPADVLPDSVLILQAYERWGERCPEKLLGAFAFVLWDGQRQVLFCARDPFGIKTLYYHHRPGRRFLVASEIKALFCVEDVPRQLNEVRVADYLTSLVEDKSVTFYKNVCQLPPAHSMTVSCTQARTKQYWSLDPAREIHYGSDEEYAEAFRDIFTEAVRCRLRSAFPIGASLSGGLDSSSIACVAERCLHKQGASPLHTFSCVFDEVPECDERDFIRPVLDRGDFESHFIHLDQRSALADIEQVLWQNDQPLFVRNTFLWTTKYEMARQHGIRVVLDGEDGDTVVSHGEAYLAELARAGRWEVFAREAEGLMHHFQSYDPSPTYLIEQYAYPYLGELREERQWFDLTRAIRGIARHFDVSYWQLLRNRVLRPMAPDTLRRLWHMLHGRAPSNGQSSSREEIHRSLVDPSFARRIGLEERRKALQARYAPVRTLREAQWQGLTGQSAWAYEEIDKIAAGHCIEARHPFHDRRLVEFCLALPPDQKLRYGWPRWILRKSMEGILPRAVQWRVGKSNLGPNFKRSLVDFERNRLEKLLFEEGTPIEPYVNISFLRKAYQYEVANYIWPAAILAIWLRQVEKTT